VADYSVFIKPSAAKELEALPPNDLERIVSRIQALSTDPRPPGCVKISGQERYRIRQGDYRMVYSVDDEQRTVLVVKIGHRKDVYRK
jgi:mRNA interferase RelE/StbE